MVQDISRDGRMLAYQVGGSIRIATWRASDGAQRDISWSDFSFARDLSRDGTRVLVSASGEGTSQNYDVFVCNIDGTGATRIGEGQAQQFSPDGKFALSVVHGPPTRLMILPLGTGEARIVATGDVTPVSARWLGDGRHLLVVGTQPGKRQRAFMVDLDGAPPRAVSPEGISFASDQLALSPDDRRVALRSPEGPVLLYPLAGGTPEPVKGLGPAEMPIAWTADGRGLAVPDGIAFRRGWTVGEEIGTGD
jgi:Tol biopolymer transport system component